MVQKQVGPEAAEGSPDLSRGFVARLCERMHSRLSQNADGGKRTSLHRWQSKPYPLGKVSRKEGTKWRGLDRQCRLHIPVRVVINVATVEQAAGRSRQVVRNAG